MQWRSALKILCDHRKSMIHKDWEIVDNVNYRIRVGYIEWRKALKIPCDRKVKCLLS